DDAEVFRADLLDARVEGAAWLLHGIEAMGARAAAGGGTGHGTASKEKGEGCPNSLGWQSEELFLIRKPTYQGTGTIAAQVPGFHLAAARDAVVRRQGRGRCGSPAWRP